MVSLRNKKNVFVEKIVSEMFSDPQHIWSSEMDIFLKTGTSDTVIVLKLRCFFLLHF